MSTPPPLQPFLAVPSDIHPDPDVVSITAIARFQGNPEAIPATTHPCPCCRANRCVDAHGITRVRTQNVARPPNLDTTVALIHTGVLVNDPCHKRTVCYPDDLDVRPDVRHVPI